MERGRGLIDGKQAGITDGYAGAYRTSSRKSERLRKRERFSISFTKIASIRFALTQRRLYEASMSRRLKL